jgi:CheY-like chemotaxis protein
MESIGTLAGGIAHDLNNALSPILMAVEILRTQVSDSTGLQMLATLETSAQHGADLVRQVLSFARGVEGKRIAVNPVHLLSDIHKIIRDTFPKNINFSFAPSQNLWTVTGDPTQLHQVFTNLCVNARDAMPNGGNLRVTMENMVLDEVYAGMNTAAQPGPYVLVKVRDTGTGIPSAIREKIFDPFFTTKEIGKGTGLGLSTTLTIIKNHAGFLKLDSESDQGTTFSIYLPANPDTRAEEAVKSGPSELVRGNGEVILVVDDEESIRIIAQTALKRFGYRVLLATNGAEAVSLYARDGEEIAVVLTDMAMPVMDGISTILSLKVMNPQIKIVASSGLESTETLSQLASVGVRHFILKPYTAKVILKTISELLNEPA